MKTIQIILIILTIGLISCKKETEHKAKHTEKKEAHKHNDNNANKHMHKSSVEDLIKSFESKERAMTQKPYEVIALFGDLKSKKILDIGSGSGYFTFRLAEKGANVIAGDVNDKFHSYIKKRMEENKVFSDKIEIRKLPYDGPALKKEEVEGVLIVNTYHHIENRIDYFSKVKNGLKEGGLLLVVDFMKKKFKEKVEGPPYKMRLSDKLVIEELKKAGFNKIEVNRELLPYQYIVKAWND